MSTSLYLKGCLLGLSIAAPVGPIGLLCIHRSLSSGTLAGIISGLGAASADALYGSIAAFGLGSFSGLLTGYGTSLRIIGGLFLCFLGFRILISRPSTAASSSPSSQSMMRNWLSVFLLTLTNPMTILSFSAIFAGFGVGLEGSLSGIPLVAGVFTGSMAWWTLLSFLCSLSRRKVTSGGMLWINRGAGSLILLMGASLLLSLIG